MSELSDFFKLMAEEKKRKEEEHRNSPAGKAVAAVQQRLKENNEMGDLLEVFVEGKKPGKTVIVEKVVEKEVIKEVVVNKDSFQQPAPQPVDPNIQGIKKKLQFLEQAIGKIAATGAGSGEVNLKYLDDINRSTIADGLFLKYNATSKKFDFAQAIGPVAELSVSRSEATVVADSDTPTTITAMQIVAPEDGNYIVSFNSEYAVESVLTATQQAAEDLDDLYAALMARNATVTDHGVTFGGETLGPGVYTVNAAMTIVGTLTLDAGNNPNALFVFRCNGAFSTGIASDVVLINGAVSSNVWFVSQGATSTGASSIMRGSMLAATGHNASSGAGSTIQGRLLTVSGNISLGATTTLTVPTGTTTSSIPLNSILLFNMFAGIGDLSNTGASIIDLSIGTNSGNITGFDSATVRGRIYPAGAAQIASISYGIYIDGVLVPDSYRSQTQSTLISKWPMAIQSVVPATAGQTIDVRTTVAIGRFTIGPAMSMVAIVASNYNGTLGGIADNDGVSDRITSPNGFYSTYINNAGETVTNGDLLPGNTNATLGSAEYPWKEIFVAPASLSILSDTPGEPTVVIGNEAGFTTISQGGFKVKHDNGTVDALVFGKTGKLTLKSEIPLATDSTAFELIGNLSGVTLPVGNRGVMIHTTGPRDIPNRIYVDGVGQQVDGESAYAAFIGRHANGTAAAPTPTLAGDTIVRFGANAYASDIGLQSISTARIDMVATENQTSTGRGSKIDFYTTKNGTTVPELTMHLEYHGIDFTGANDPNVGIIFKDGSLLKNWPSVTGNTGKILRTDGSTFFWGSETVPSGSVIFKGDWSATNPPGGGTPTISDATGTAGWQYIVNAAGTQNLGSGNITFAIGDLVIHNGTRYIKIDGTTPHPQANWTETNSALPAFIQNKPTLHPVATSGSYVDLNNKPTIPAAQINSDWNAVSGVSQILNKPTIPVIPTIDYGQFARYTDFTYEAANTAYALTLDTTAISSGISRGSPTSRIIVSKTGVYEIQASVQLRTTSNKGICYLWLRKNGTNIVDTTRREYVQGQDEIWNFSYSMLISLVANDYIELYTAATNNNLYLDFQAATAFAPRTASVLLSVKQVTL